MPVDVVMPQMGESIAEGTISRWLKKVGDKVERDEPILEISTDKVDAEIPAPSAGVVAEILANEGDTVAVNSVVARITVDGESADSPASPPPPATAEEPAAATAEAEPPTPAPAAEVEPAADADVDEQRRTRSSPVVRKIAQEHGIDIRAVDGTGLAGRVTKRDILEHIQKPVAKAASAPAATRPAQHAGPLFAPGENVRVEPMSVMRKRIADHMIISKQTSAHVTTVFEVDFSAIARLRAQHRASYAERGAKLTYLPFIIQAVNVALREFPILNASTDGENIVYKNDLNIGVAVALDWGLIVPVIRKSDEKNLLGLARTVNDLGERARTKKLNPDEVQGGTFTITNPGIYGGLFGTPIINQPQVAILGVGGIKKKPVVVESEDGDSIAIRSMCYLALTFDHRLIDGAVADQFMARIRSIIESGQFTM